MNLRQPITIISHNRNEIILCLLSTQLLFLVLLLRLQRPVHFIDQFSVKQAVAGCLVPPFSVNLYIGFDFF